MIPGWRQTELGAVLTLQRGFDLPIQERREGLVPVVSSSGITGKHSKAMVGAPGVITGRYGTIGQTFFLREDFWPLNTTLFVKDFKGNDPHFVYYLLKTIDFASCSDKSSVPGVNRNHLHSLRVSVPESANEQRAIAHVLGTLDDKIELNRRMNETLEAMARAIFKSWFVDFDLVRAKAQGLQPSGMDAATAALFPASFDDSPLGKIPKGWSATNLAELALLNPEVWTRQNPPDHIEYVDLSNVKWGRIETTAPYLWKDAPSRAQRVLRPGDTIVGTVRPGNGSYAFINDNGLTGSTGFAMLRPRKSFFREIVYLSATALDNIENLAHLADGAAYPAVRPDTVASTDLPKAPDPIIDCFSKAVGPLLNKIATNRVESRTLATTRDALLPKLISGEIRVTSGKRFGSDRPSRPILNRSDG